MARDRNISARPYYFHPWTCLAMAIVIAVLSWLNLRCELFYQWGSTSALSFRHGWPLSFQDGIVRNQHGMGYWAHPDDPDVMQLYAKELETLPRMPWSLVPLAKIRVFGAVIDLILAFLILTFVSVACEVALRENDREADSSRWIATLLLLAATAAACAVILVVESWPYVVPAFGVVILAVVTTVGCLARGYDERANELTAEVDPYRKE